MVNSRSKQRRTQKNRKYKKRNEYKLKQRTVKSKKYSSKNKNKKSQSKRKSTKNRKSRRRMIQQRGGFVNPFGPEIKNLITRDMPYKISEHYHKLNPAPYPAPGNPDKVDINPHPAYDQFLRGNSKMIDPADVLGPNLKQEFDQSIQVNNNM